MSCQTHNPRLSARFGEALLLATRLHADPARKGTQIPYLMAVAATVLENGGDENTAIAALLHDAAEDQGGVPTLNMVREHFGER
ncbi:MAG: HD domain-containing protein, partial [Burkholderiales bacterium]